MGRYSGWNASSRLGAAPDRSARRSARRPPVGFNSTFASLGRGDEARSRRVQTIEDAAPESSHWRAGFGYEFVGRPDGYPGLVAAYGLRFPQPPRVMDLTLSYRALASGQ